jgi:hypothetical protein
MAYTNGSSKSAATLEREAEQTRVQLAATLDELRQSLSPGQLLDQCVEYAKQSGGSDFLRNLGQQVRANPLPVTLVGAGIAWLALSGRTSSRSYGSSMRGSGNGSMARTARHAGSAMSDAAGSASSAVSDAASRASGAMSDAASQASDAISSGVSGARETMAGATESVSSMYGDARRTAQHASERVSGGLAAAGDAAWRSGRQIGAASGSIAELFREQPLLLAALGVAVGAAIGAALPRTETEDAYMGAASDSVRDQAEDMASEQYEQLKETAEQTVSAAKSEAKAQGLTPDAADDAPGDVVDKAESVSRAALDAVSKGLEKSGDSLSRSADRMMPASEETGHSRQT